MSQNDKFQRSITLIEANLPSSSGADNQLSVGGINPRTPEQSQSSNIIEDEITCPVFETLYNNLHYLTNLLNYHFLLILSIVSWHRVIV